jgi:hypothetical protein
VPPFCLLWVHNDLLFPPPPATSQCIVYFSLSWVIYRWCG